MHKRLVLYMPSVTPSVTRSSWPTTLDAPPQSERPSLIRARPRSHPQSPSLQAAGQSELVVRATRVHEPTAGSPTPQDLRRQQRQSRHSAYSSLHHCELLTVLRLVSGVERGPVVATVAVEVAATSSAG
jgi:hypothetical protein